MPKACRVLSISASEKSRFAIGGPPWFAFSVPAESPASRGMLVAKRKIIPIVLTYASLTRSAYAYRLLKSTLRCWVPLCQELISVFRARLSSFCLLFTTLCGPFCRRPQAGRVAFAKDQRKSRGNVGREPAARLASCWRKEL